MQGDRIRIKLKSENYPIQRVSLRVTNNCAMCTTYFVSSTASGDAHAQYDLCLFVFCLFSLNISS